MASKLLLLVGFAVAALLLISSQVSARDLSQASVDASKQAEGESLNNANYYYGGYGGYPSYGGYGGYGGYRSYYGGGYGGGYPRYYGGYGGYPHYPAEIGPKN
ncbi:hypothetical protein M569_17572 [Genlisea aurea]|uniref:Glycine rich protein n=1 Tax=Genlisea aurea TaxID=192259 RepID=S8D3H0_9LAMI|nr:hypothetical protein M569_17572 [Genlisea aurea]